MSQTSVLSMTPVDPTTRSAVYKLLSVVFKYPTQEIFQAYQSGDFLSELFDAMSMFPHMRGLGDVAGLIEKVQKDLEKMTFRDFEVKHAQTFDVGAPEPPCPPYEGVYRDGIERTGILIEVSEFYKQFGLKTNPEEGKRELADNLSAELEFLHFLTFKEAQAREEGNQELLKGYVLAQKDFLERHMINWIPKFSEKMQKSSTVPLYAELAKITSAFANSELGLVRSMLEEFGDGQGEEKDNGKRESV